MNIHRTFLAAAVLGIVAGSSAFAETINFDDPVITSATQAPGVWYTDRSAPDSFQSGVAYGGHATTLEVGIDGADFRGPTTSPPNFYDTEGRKYDLDAGTKSMSIELYIDEAFGVGDDRRLAGFWGTAFDGVPSLSAYPIIELDRINSDLVFRGWNNAGSGSWFNIATLGAGDLGTWQTLSISITGSDFTYSAGGTSATTDAFGSTSIGNVILQAHNTGSDYTVHWDTLTTSVPEPGAWALMILGFGAAGGAIRRRRVLSHA